MKKLVIKKNVCVAVASLISVSTVAPSMAKAQERQTVESKNLKIYDGVGDDVRNILDTEKAIILAVSGVDISKDIPLLSKLFPEKNEIDYERIARDVARIVKQAFVENNIFDQQAKLAATNVGLKRYITVGKSDDNYLRGRLDHLDEIMARVSTDDLRIPAAGYYASAAQASLGVMALRIASEPGTPGLKLAAWDSLREYREHTNKLSNEIRDMEKKKLYDEKVVSVCAHFPPNIPNAFLDNTTGQLHAFNSMNECERARDANVEARVTSTDYLKSLIQSWMKTEIANLGGQQAVIAFEKLGSVEMAKKHNVADYNMKTIQQHVVAFTAPEFYKAHVLNTCNAFGMAIAESQYYKGFPQGDGPRGALLVDLGCPASAGYQP